MPFRHPILAFVLAALTASAQAAVSTQGFSHLLERGDNLPEGLEVVNLSVDRFAAALGSLTGSSSPWPRTSPAGRFSTTRPIAISATPRATP